MQKLTILIAITLLPVFHLSADNEPILLDRDILYWKPAGPDIEVPDVFFHPDLLSYEDAAFDNFFPSPTLDGLPDSNLRYEKNNDTQMEPGDPVSLDWSPPPLSFLQPVNDREIRLSGSTPYGYGASLRGYSGLFTYETDGNFDPHGEVPDWLKGSLDFDQKVHHLSGSAGWRDFERSELFTLFQWRRTGGHLYLSLNSGLQFKNIFNPDAPEDQIWSASGNLSLKKMIPPFDLFTSLESEYLSKPGGSGWRITPGFLSEGVFALSSGDLTLSLGGLGDIYSKDFSIFFYPDLGIMFRNHGTFSFFVESRGVGIAETELFSFLLEETYLSQDIGFIRRQQNRTGITFTLSRFQGYTAAGLSRGTMPVIRNGLLVQEDRDLFFSELNLSCLLFRGNIMEINSYADYQDKGEFRFLGIYRMTFKNIRFSPSFDLHAGSRELIRGVRDFYYIESDRLYGIGFELELSGNLKLSSTLDYADPLGHIEGGAALSYSF